MTERRIVASIVLLPDESLRCAALGNHAFPDDPPLIDAPAWGAGAVKASLVCPCGRIREDVWAAEGEGDLLYRDYSGGFGVAAGAQVHDRSEYRAEWFRRLRAKRAGVVTLDEKRRNTAG